MPAFAHLLLGALLAGLPQSFDQDPGFEAKPSFLGNPAEHPTITARDGAVQLRVDEPGKGMKFALPVRFSSDAAVYLVLRYRARNLAGGYALWVYDDTPGGQELLNIGELEQDGQPHVVAVDLWARGASGGVRTILTEVECRGEPAELWFDELSLEDKPPAGATIVPDQPRAEAEQRIRASDLGELQPHPDWLQMPAKQFGAEVADGVLHLSVDEPGNGMKWSAMLAEPVDLAPFRFVTIRYRARNLLPWGDYLVWLGSGPGGLPDASDQPLRLHQADADGEWHTAVLPLTRNDFAAAQVALQVSCAAERGEVWLDYLRFTTRRPRVPIAELLPCTTGWGASRLPADQAQLVDLSQAANADATVRGRGFGFDGWLPAGQVTVRGIPFLIPEGPHSVLATGPVVPLVSSDDGAVDLNAAASEAYLLLAAKLPSLDTAGMGDPRPFSKFSDPERFRVRVHYADEVVDEQFPVRLGSGSYEVHAGIDVYCLTGLRPQPIRWITLLNRMDSGAFLLGGLTLNRGRPLTATPPVNGLPPAAPARAETAVRRPEHAVSDGLVELGLDLDTATLAALGNLLLPRDQCAVEPGPLFELGDAKPTCGPAQEDLLDGGRRWTVPFRSGVGLTGKLVIATTDQQGVLLSLEVTNAGDQPLTPHVSFPVLRNVRLGEVADTWYLSGEKGGVISNRPTHRRHSYGGEQPLQLVDLFNPTLGAGLAVLTEDLDDVYRFWDLTKDDRGVTLRVDYQPYELQPGETLRCAPTRLRTHSGDWRRGLALYRDWVKTWYRPMVPRKPWFQRTFDYQQVFAWGQLRNPAGGDWTMAPVVERYQTLFGHLDYLHIFDFGESKVYGRVGDYNHYDELGGLAVMQRAIRWTQELGIRVGLYIEGYNCDERCEWGKDQVLANNMRLADGSSMLYSGEGTEHVMCPSAQPWRDHLAEVYHRVAGELHPDGMYIDQYGFVHPGRLCWSRDHGHPVPWPTLRGEGETLQAIRKAVPPEIATLTEETPNDVHLQYQDGALGYSATWHDRELAPHGIDLVRFVFPDFKVFQLVSYNPFIEGAWGLLKVPFFNGEGYWLHQSPQDYCPDARHFLTAAFQALNEPAFAAEDVEPLVPTLQPTLFANRFTSPDETVWTVFNGHYRTFRGPALTVPHRQGTTYRDGLHGPDLRFTVADGQATIEVELGPRDVGCIVARR